MLSGLFSFFFLFTLIVRFQHCLKQRQKQFPCFELCGNLHWHLWPLLLHNLGPTTNLWWVIGLRLSHKYSKTQGGSSSAVFFSLKKKKLYTIVLVAVTLNSWGQAKQPTQLYTTACLMAPITEKKQESCPYVVLTNRESFLTVCSLDKHCDLTFFLFYKIIKLITLSFFASLPVWFSRITL